MNDRFKFRIWYKNNYIYFNLKDVIYESDGYSADICKNGIFEQCTGLKDKNGKLIYEGDKVKAKLNHNYKGNIIDFNWHFLDCDNYEVVLDSGIFKLKPITKKACDYPFLFDTWALCIEIIVDIHEENIKDYNYE